MRGNATFNERMQPLRGKEGPAAFRTARFFGVFTPRRCHPPARGSHTRHFTAVQRLCHNLSGWDSGGRGGNVVWQGVALFRKPTLVMIAGPSWVRPSRTRVPVLKHEGEVRPMLRHPRLWLAALVLGWAMTSATAQTPPPPSTRPPPPRPPSSPRPRPYPTQLPEAAPLSRCHPWGQCAVVNGQAHSGGRHPAWPETSGCLQALAARPELLDYLVDNLLIDQYLKQCCRSRSKPPMWTSAWSR